MEEDAAATNVSVLTNDTDIDGGPKTISSASDPANGTVVVTGGGSGLTYQPDPNYCNDPPATNLDIFTYTLNGDSQGTVSMTVTCVNDNPVATDESFNGRLRDECLGMEWFRNRAEAATVIETFRAHYNAVRPHSSLGYLTPNEFKMKFSDSGSNRGRATSK